MPIDPESEAILDYLKQPSTDTPAGPGCSAAETTALQMFGIAGRRRKPFTPMERLLLPPGRPFTGAEAEMARAHARCWEDYGFQLHEVQTWLRAGLEPSDADLAALLIEEGIESYRLNEQLTHPVTGERLTILEVAHRLPQRHPYNSDVTLCDVLDEAMIERTRAEPVLPSWLRRRGTAS